MKLDPYNLDIFVDITTNCNAGCPMCHRTNPKNKCKTADWLPTIDWSLEQFKKAYPENVIKVAKKLTICGTWGDPIINKDFLNIIKYVREVNKNVLLSVHTNGSLRDENWWWDLGTIGDKKLHVYFAIEGINQEMHELYRQKTFLNKILNNMQILANTKAIVNSQTLIFKHNEPYLKDIEQLCYDNGSKWHQHIYTDRFRQNKHYAFVDSKGKEQILEKAISKMPQNTTIIEQKNLSVRREDYQNKKYKLKVATTRRQDNTPKILKKITCKWENDNRILVNPDGQVLPCCYFANTHFFNATTNATNDLIRHPIIQHYNQYKKSHNVFHNNLLDIIKNDWFRKELPDSWKSNKPVPQCSKFCGS